MMKLSEESEQFLSLRLQQLREQFSDDLKAQSFQLTYWRSDEIDSTALPVDHSHWDISDQAFHVLKASGFVDLLLRLLADFFDWLQIAEKRQYKKLIANRLGLQLTASSDDTEFVVEIIDIQLD